METCFNYVDKEVAFFSSDEKRWINKIHKLKERFPDQITIIAEPETNDGCIYCKLPVAALKVSLTEKRELTDEQKAALTKNLVSARAKKAEM